MSIQPKLRQFDLTMIVVSLVIGVGIFRNPQIVAQKAGSESIFFAAWLFGGIVAICGAFTFAEIGARLPVAGGYYKIFSYAYHPAYAFMLNWSQLIINAGSSAGVAIIGAEYLQPLLFPSHSSMINVLAVTIILLLSAVNFLGIKTGARVQNALSLLKIILILVCCLALFGGSSMAAPAMGTPANSGVLRAFGASLVAVFFTYGGYQNTVNFGADMQDARRKLPRSIFGGILIIISLYILLNVAYVRVIGFAKMQQTPLLASALASALFGSTGARIASLLLGISVLGFLNTSFLSNPRVYYAMSEERILPALFGKVNAKTQVQDFALGFFISVMLISLFVLGTFDRIVDYVIFIDSLSLASAAASIFILRRRSAPGYRGFRMPLYPFIPVLFTLGQLFVTYNTIISDPRSSLYGFCIFAGGLPLYIFMKRVVR